MNNNNNCRHCYRPPGIHFSAYNNVTPWLELDSRINAVSRPGEYRGWACTAPRRFRPDVASTRLCGTGRIRPLLPYRRYGIMPCPAILCSINVETDKAAALVSSAVSDNPLIGDFNKSLRGHDARVAMIIDRAATITVTLPPSWVGQWAQLGRNCCKFDKLR